MALTEHEHLGFSYNTERESLKIPEYGRTVQQMVDYCVSIRDRDRFQRILQMYDTPLKAVQVRFEKITKRVEDLGVSKYVLSRLFSKTFHRNFNQYLNAARLNYACHRLENTRDSITNICLDSGFESQRTFNRVFKERYKISPSDYRSTCVKEMLS